MNRTLLAGVLVLGCIAGLALGRGQSTQEAITQPSPAILVGGCNGVQSPNEPYIVFGLGQEEFTCDEITQLPFTTGVPMGSAGTLQNLRLANGRERDLTPGSVATVYLNGTATALACTVSASSTCVDSMHKVTVKAGDLVAATYSAPDGNLDMIMSLEKR
jgi:hypothetical protein